MVLYTKDNIKKCKEKSSLNRENFSNLKGIISTLFNIGLVISQDDEWFIFDRYYKQNDKKIRAYVKRVLHRFDREKYLKFISYGRANPYDPEFIMIRDCVSIEDAEITIFDLKLRTSGSLSAYISRYGEEEGTIKYNEFCKKSAHSLDTYTKKYGEEEGAIKYKEYLKTKDSTSLEFHIKKYGEEEGRKMYNKRVEGISNSEERFIKKYGEEEGKRRFNEANKKRSYSCSTPSLIKKFGYDKAMEINASKATMSPERSLKYYIDKYGMEEGYLAFKAFLTSSNRVNGDTEFLVDIYIKHLGFEEGLIEYMKRKKIKQKREQASKASVEVFKESMEFLSKKGIQYNIGTGDNKEFIIQNDIKKYFYDFTIPSLNLIFEYQGEHVHPNPNKDLSNWRQVFTNETAEEVQDKYNIKLQAAIDEGFEVVEIWSSNFYKDNSKIVLNKIKEKLNDGEII